MSLTAEERGAWERDGFFFRRGFASTDVVAAMHDAVVGIARGADGALIHEGHIVTPESNLAGSASSDAPAERTVSKIFKLHREAAFRDFIESPAVIALLSSLLGDEVDCFLSQYIFKNPGAWGQPWHQDSFYFRFDRGPQVGLWLAVTEATLDNGCLHVLPGSHREPVHEHVQDRRPDANFGYVEIVDHDMAASVPVTMAPGDLLVFHSHLMHRSTDNESAGNREAMVFHAAERGTKDLAGRESPVNDWMPLAVGG